MRKLFDKIWIFGILKNHVDTYRHAASRKIKFDTIIVFIVLPLAIAAPLTYYYWETVDGSVINLIITILSIFIGLLINVVVLIFDLRAKVRHKIEQLGQSKQEEIPQPSVKVTRERFYAAALQECISNIMYIILASVLSILISFCCFSKQEVVQIISIFIWHFLLFHMLFTFLNILKKLNLVFVYEVK